MILLANSALPGASVDSVRTQKGILVDCPVFDDSSEILSCSLAPERNASYVPDLVSYFGLVCEVGCI